MTSGYIYQQELGLNRFLFCNILTEVFAVLVWTYQKDA